MDKVDLAKRQKMVNTLMDIQSDYFSKHSTRVDKFEPEIGGYVAPGAGSEMVDPIMWEELLKEFRSPDDAAAEYVKRNAKDIPEVKIKRPM